MHLGYRNDTLEVMSLPFTLPPFTKRTWQLTAVGVAGICVLAYFLMGRSTSLGATLTITPADFSEQVSVSGTVTASQEVTLGFAANGRISGVYARVGQHVSMGTVIAETENGDLAALLVQKQSALKQAQANLASLEAGTRPEEIAVAQTAVSNAEAVLVTALQTAYTVSDDAVHNRVDAFFVNPRTQPKLAFAVPNATLQTTVEQDRASVEPLFTQWANLMKTLTPDTAASVVTQIQGYLQKITTLLADANLALNQGIPDQTTTSAVLAADSTSLGVARNNVNTALTALTADAAALDAAESTLTLEQSGSTPDAITAQEAVVSAAEAEVRSATAQLAKTRVVAPFSGIVTRMDAKVGEVVSPTTNEIAMQSDGVFQIETYIPEVTIARVATGNPATTTLDAYGPSVPFPSIVVSVDPAETIKDGVPTYKTVLSFRTADDRIRSGMTANVVIETGRLAQAIVIPAGSVRTEHGASYVSVVSRGKATHRPVTLGPSPALGEAQVLSGLSAGEVILLSPAP